MCDEIKKLCKNIKIILLFRPLKFKEKKSYWSQKETDRSGGLGYRASPGDTDGLESAVITCHHARWQLFLYTAGLRRVLWRTNDSRAVAGWSCNDLLDQTTGKWSFSRHTWKLSGLWCVQIYISTVSWSLAELKRPQCCSFNPTGPPRQEVFE